ncbi:MAG TPA: T9SS type A sorting domain-containing protein [Candidatus Cloacimonadota bacterium]|nr:T9SS type A sorting domain-containing protein [Candidatus Cloacimonadota bacterium]
MKEILSHGAKPSSLNSFIRMSRMLLLLAILLVTCNALFAYDLYVDLAADPILANGSLAYPYVLIQDAIDHAFDDSLPENQTSPAVVIKIFDATSCYTENLDINYMVSFQTHLVTNLTLMSISDNPEACMITALNSTLPVVQVKGNSTCTLSVRGLTIKHNQMVNQVFNKGILLGIPSGIYGYFDTLEVENCIFDNNHVAIEVDPGIVTINSLKVAYSVINMIQSYYGVSRGIDANAGGNSSTTKIVGNKFIRHNPNYLESEAVVLGGKFSSIVLNENQFTYANAYTANNFNLQDVEVCGNRFYESSLMLTNRGTWLIEQNKFVGLSSPGSPSAIRLHGGVQGVVTECSINENIFFGSFQPLEIKFPGNLYTSCKVNAALERNSFINCGGILSLQRLSNQQASSNSVSMFRNNLYNGTNNAPFIVIDQNNNNLTLTGNNLIPVSYSHFYALLTGTASLLLDTPSVSYGNPYITIDNTAHTYTLDWNTNVRSPLIMTGYSGVLVSTWYNRRDIGAIQYEGYPHEYIRYDFPSSTLNNGIKWMSFPTLDRLWNPSVNDPSEAHTFFEPLRNINTLNEIRWKPISEGEKTLRVGLGGAWLGDNHEIRPEQGYKVTMAQSLVNPISISTPGIITPEDTPIELQAYRSANGRITVNDNWIGYFIKKTLHFTEAFAAIIDNLYFIQTQFWTACRERPEPGYPWIVALDIYRTPTLSYGDMAVVRCFENASFIWNSTPPEREPLVKALPSYFKYTEKLEYIPIYMDFSGIDMPKEVGIFINNECMGAAVVTDSFVEVPAYIVEGVEEYVEIEVRLFYDDKAAPVRIVQPMIWDEATASYNNGNLCIREKKDYYMVKFGGTTTSEAAPELKPELTISPNPFNPSTSIGFKITNDEHVSIKIYNVRGQCVKTLVDQSKTAGVHSIEFNGRDSNNKPLASGIYFTTLSQGGKTITKKMILMK